MQSAKTRKRKQEHKLAASSSYGYTVIENALFHHRGNIAVEDLQRELAATKALLHEAIGPSEGKHKREDGYATFQPM